MVVCHAKLALFLTFHAFGSPVNCYFVALKKRISRKNRTFFFFLLLFFVGVVVLSY